MLKKILLCFCLFFFLSSIPSFAQLKLDNNEIRVEVYAGEAVSADVRVENGTSAPVNVKAYFEDFIFPDPFDGRKQPLPLGSTPHSCGQWISVLPAEFLLQSEKSQKVTCSIQVPPDAQGSYYGVLFFEKASESPSGGVGVTVRVGCPFFVNVKGSQPQAEITAQSNKTDALELTIRNSGKTLLVANGSYTVLDEASVAVDRGAIPKVYLPAGEAKLMEVILAKVPASEKQYVLAVILNVGGGANIINEIIFTKDNTGRVRVTQEK
jgi:hypothetical protein